MNESLKPLLATIRKLEAENAMLREQQDNLVDEKLSNRAAIDKLSMRSDKQSREILRLERRHDALEALVLEMASKQPRIEREVTRFEKLNNNNTFGG
jgi:chromosome segregation ATPase